MAEPTLAPMFQFGPWLPDEPLIGEGANLQVARNCYMRAGAYRPCRAFGPVQATTHEVVAKTVFTDTSGAVRNYALTRAGDLVRFTGTGFTVVIAAATLGLGTSLTPETCDIIAFGDRVVVCSNASKLKSFLSTESSPTLKTHNDSPQGATVLSVHRQFMFAAVKSTLYWSDSNNLDKWITSSEPGLSGSVVNRVGGNIRAIVGDSNVIIMSARAIAVLVFGGPSIFQFRYLRQEYGCASTKLGVARNDQWWYFISEIGIHCVNDALAVQDIGVNRCNLWLAGSDGRLRPDGGAVQAQDVTAANFREAGLILWHMGDREADNVLIYSANDDAFTTASYSDLDALHVFAADLQVNLDATPLPFGSQLDAVDVNLDSASFEQSGQVMIGYRGNAISSLLFDVPDTGDEDGLVLPLEIETKIIPFSVLFGKPQDGEPRLVHHIRLNGRVDVRWAFPVKRGGRASMQFLARDIATNQLPDYDGIPLSLEQPNGHCPLDAGGVYFSASLVVSGNWSECHGMNIGLREGGVSGTSLDWDFLKVNRDTGAAEPA